MAPLDLREQTDDPIEGFYLAMGNPFLLSVPLKDCRILHATALRCGKADYNPLVETCLEFAKNPSLGPENSALKRFYEAWQPANAAEMLGFSGHPRLITQPPYLYIYPWQNFSLLDKQERVEEWIRSDSDQYGMKLSLRDGWKEYGPLSENALELELNRLRSVYASVRSKGFIPGENSSYICAVGLADKTDIRFSISPGHHRIAALSANGFEVAPILITQRIVRDEVESWPHVRSAFYSIKDALHIFDRLFEGRSDSQF